ncbi:MAG: MinD/ParA family protein [Desulfobacteraceae bacterium]|nr:MinD/ParA family protein [Desulfobacteraceae bacterium]
MTAKKRPPTTICVASGKGGVGKTSLSVNLAYALVKSGSRVLLVDGDLGLANVDLLLGIPIKQTIRNLLDESGNPQDSLVFPIENLGILPATSGVPEMVTLGPDEQSRLNGFIEDLAVGFDFVILDTAAGIGPSVLWFNRQALYNIVVLTPDPTSITDAYALMKVMARQHPKNAFFTILNAVANEREGRKVYNNLQQVVSQFLSMELELLGTIPADPAVNRAVKAQTPFIQSEPECPAGMAVSTIAAKIEKWGK